MAISLSSSNSFSGEWAIKLAYILGLVKGWVSIFFISIFLLRQILQIWSLCFLLSLSLSLILFSLDNFIANGLMGYCWTIYRIISVNIFGKFYSTPPSSLSIQIAIKEVNSSSLSKNKASILIFSCLSRDIGLIPFSYWWLEPYASNVFGTKLCSMYYANNQIWNANN